MQVNLIDMQAQGGGKYKFMIVYQDHLIKLVLRAYTLLDMFTTYSALYIL